MDDAPTLTDAEMQARLLYRDGMMLIVDKPAGIPVHAGPGGGDCLEAHFDALRFGWPHPPALAHRLDSDTSGCLVLGRHRKALRRLGRLFSEGLVEKIYWAVVEGAPPDDVGTIDVALRKVSTRAEGWRMVAGKGGRPAVTDYRLLGSAGGRSWLELRPRTGRTHQIRVHLAALGCPVVGDPVYGRAGGPTMLHARRVVVPLHKDKPPVECEAPIPPHMTEAIAPMEAPASA